MSLADRLNELRLRNPDPTTDTQEIARCWSLLPELIRRDPSMASLRSLHELSSDTADHPGDAESSFSTASTRRSGSDDEHDDAADALPTIGMAPAMEKQASHGRWTWSRQLTISALCCFVLACVLIMSRTDAKSLVQRTWVVPRNGVTHLQVPLSPSSTKCAISVRGSLLPQSSVRNSSRYLRLSVRSSNPQHLLRNEWQLALAPESEMDTVQPSVIQRSFDFDPPEANGSNILHLQLDTNLPVDAAYEITVDRTPANRSYSAALAALLLLFLYASIIAEVLPRTFAAILASVGGIALLTYYEAQPTLPEVMQWLEVDTMLLLVAMMLLVAVLGETGIFDWLAVLVFRTSGGRVWPLVHALCLLTAAVSACLDNVTTVLLMTPVCLRLCEVMSLNPRPILMAIVMHAHVGGALTPVGDPLSLIVFGSAVVRERGITFLTYTLNMLPGCLAILATAAATLHYQYRRVASLRLYVCADRAQLQREIRIWKRAALKLSNISAVVLPVRHTLLAKVDELQHRLRDMEKRPPVEYSLTLAELRLKYPIKDPILLAKACACLAFIVLLFCTQALPGIRLLSLGWCALLGILLLLCLIEEANMDTLLHRVDWSALLFLGCMFVTMTCVQRLGLIDVLGAFTRDAIAQVAVAWQRQCAALVLVLWGSMLCAAFVDSYVVAAMMMQVVVAQVGVPSGGGAAAAEALVPLQPLVWATALGTALGSGGSLYGATANVVAANAAEEHGYRIGFGAYLRESFPRVAVATAAVTAILLIGHVAMDFGQLGAT